MYNSESDVEDHVELFEADGTEGTEKAVLDANEFVPEIHKPFDQELFHGGLRSDRGGGEFVVMAIERQQNPEAGKAGDKDTWRRHGFSFLGLDH